MAAAVATVPGEPSNTTSRFVQFIHGPTKPVDFPASILNGLTSTDVGVQRAAIAELQTYLKQLFFLPMRNYFYISNLVTAGIICLIIVIGFPVVLHRLYHGRLHLFRLERRAQGSFLVPNAINCFLLIQGVYGIVTVGFNFIVWQLLKNKQGMWMKLFPAARVLVWVPLYVGAFLTGWGSFYTAPGALDKPTAARNKTSAKGHLRWPLIVNLSCWGVPVALIASLLPSVCLSGIKMNKTFNDWIDWDHRVIALVASTLSDALVDQAALDGLRSQASTIFYNWSQAYYYTDIGYVVWGFWALLFLVFYVPAGGVLVYLLYRQVQRQRGILLSYQRKVDAQIAQEEKQTQVSVLTGESRAESAGRQARGRSMPSGQQPMWSAVPPPTTPGAPLEDIFEDRDRSDVSEGTEQSGATPSMKSAQEMIGLESALQQDPPKLSPPPNANVNAVPSPRRGQAAGGSSGHGCSERTDKTQSGSPTIAPSTPKPPSAFRRLMRMETKTSSQRGGQESTIKSARRKRLSISGGPMSRYRYLRRCLINLLILYFGIISAACFFGAITIWLAAVEYEHALRGPHELAKVIGIGGSTAAWVSAVFGVLTIGSIIFRNFDNPQPDASQHSGEGGGAAGGLRRRFNRNTSRTTASGSAGEEQPAAAGGHEKTRTLPAVPESVDLEASMMSMVQSRPRMAMNTQMRFAMAEQTSRPGGFVIRPDDPLSSMMSAGEMADAEESRRDAPNESFGRGGKVKGQTGRAPPLASRSHLIREREATMSVPQDVTESFGLGSLPMIAVGSDAVRTRPGAVDLSVDASVDAQGHFRTNDTTLAEYPSYDPRVIKGADQMTPSGSMDLKPSPRQSPKVRQQSPKIKQKSPQIKSSQESPTLPTSPASLVIKRQSKRFEGADSETPASKIAREWAQSQYAAAPLPETPTKGGARRRDTEALTSKKDEGAWLGDLEGSPPVSPRWTPSRPARDLRRLLGSRGSDQIQSS